MTGLGSSCGACKFLRRKCINECVFAPYFCYEEGTTHFAAVHKVFGASNVSKLLQHLPVQNRGEAAITISYEALARMRDPVYGCVAHIFALQQQVASLQEEIEILGTHVANFANNGVTHGNSEEMNYPINGFGFASQEDAIHNYLTQQAPHQPSCMLNTTDDIGLNYGEMNIQLPRPYGWRDQTLFYEATNEPTSSERSLVEMDQTFLTSDYPWLDNANYADY